MKSNLGVSATVVLMLAIGVTCAMASNVVVLNEESETIPHASLEEAFSAVESNQEIHIFGRHEVIPGLTGGARGTVMSPLYLLGKTNIVVRGFSGATIAGEGVGDYLVIEQCSQISVKNVAFVGDRPPAGEVTNGIFSMIQLRGGNTDILVSECRFENFGDHGVSHLWDPKLSERVTVRDCVFKDGGDLDVPGLSIDGAAVSGIGSRWKILNNYVVGCVRGFEVENSGENVITDVLIEGNTLVDIKDLGVMLFATNGDGNKYRSIKIQNNSFDDFNYAPGSATAIRLAGGTDILVQGNTIRGMARQGISFVSIQGSISDLQINGNSISYIGNNGIVLTGSTHGSGRTHLIF